MRLIIGPVFKESEIYVKNPILSAIASEVVLQTLEGFLVGFFWKVTEGRNWQR